MPGSDHSLARFCGLAVFFSLALTAVGVGQQNDNPFPLTVPSPDLSPSTDASPAPSSVKGRGQLGATLSRLTPAELRAEKLVRGIQAASDAMVAGVVPGSAAEAAGVRAGDFVVQIDGQIVGSYSDVIRTVGSFPAGKTVTLVIDRRGQRLRLAATLEPRADQIPQAYVQEQVHLAVAGDAQAQFNVGVAYHGGTWGTKDLVKARRWLEAAAKGGIGHAYLVLAESYEKGEVESQNLAFARELYEVCAAEGEADAQARLGTILLEGIGGNMDTPRGVKMYELAVNQGHATAAQNLARLYERGNLGTIDYTKAFALYKQAAENGLREAAARVGYMYASGTGTAKDYASAIRWLTIAAEANVADAQHDLGVLYSNGQGVAQDVATGAKWISAAAEQGHVLAMSHLGRMYFHANPPDLPKTVYWLTRASDDGDSGAKWYLGAMYYQGKGVGKDSTKAFALMTEAANAGHIGAQWQLGGMYVDAPASERNHQLGLQWLTKAVADPGLSDDKRGKALFLLASIYEGTAGVSNVTPDKAQALDYYGQAAKVGHVESQFVYGSKLSDQGRHQEAVKWLREAATRGNRSAQNNLGTMYYYGRGVAQSRQEAIGWWLKAYRQGSTTARDSLRKLGIEAK